MESSKQLYSHSDSKVLTANTRKVEDAAYLHAWIDKVEKIGALNYPDEARRRNLSGELELEVTLNADGSLVSIDLLRSSGHEVLDEAARRIVRLAAPFPAVPANVLDGDQGVAYPPPLAIHHRRPTRWSITRKRKYHLKFARYRSAVRP